MDDQELDQHLRDIQRDYLNFLDDGEDQGIYMNAVKNMLADDKRRLVVNVNDLRRKNPERAAALLSKSFEEQVAFQKALKEYVASIDSTYSKDNTEFFVAFEGSFGNKHVTPRSLTSKYLGNLICVEGIVTRCSLIRPKVVRSVHYCPATKKVMERKYADLTSLEAFPTSSVYPTKDEDGNLLETEFGLSTYKDHQTISLQEMPEKAPAGQLPRSVDVICDDDLVDLCKPGDRIQVVGNFRCLPSKQGGFTNGTFRTIVIANNISQLSKESTRSISREDVVVCKKLAKSKDIIEILSRSLAPSIHGHDFIKRAILCLLVGGIEKVLKNGTRLRGDINILLIGDPSVAKSQLLRYVLYTAPRAIPTTGRGSSGVGLTAAVTTDQETGERRLEAGAMVLADRGVVCIDEFDKMSDIDRTAIHEVMEQGRVTISKAGIHASLNARCSVLAAANPVYGRYDQYKTPMENIGLQDSLLSRFDLLFVMLDVVDAEIDSMISDHVVRMHRYRKPGEQDGEVLPMGLNVEMLSTHDPDADDENNKVPVYEKYEPLLHGKSRARNERILSAGFMRKYIYVAKMMKPKLTEEATELIADEYSKLRSEDAMDMDVARTQPVTARTLETLIRLATAHAKARLSPIISVSDAEAAIELVQYAYFKKVLEKEKKKKRRRDQSEDEESDEEVHTEHTQEEEEVESRPKRSRRMRKSVDEGTQEDVDMTQVTPQDPGDLTRRSTRSEMSKVGGGDTSLQEISQELAGSITDERLSKFKISLQRMFREERKDAISVKSVTEFINTEHAMEPFNENEIQLALHKMTEANQIMIADDFVFLI
ncbi:DNA replication licensing factor Mcm3 isoform X1 [Chrysoperla carnea]|uniref:DNA replication licensing factor Mcm3 isoform X1 n=1 Tax=Chrysoperla carnea TaxID=189513 RepID=UPI001D06B267|nr:DNA replication licensing factor Mcm3 isoform X1 [Chrysoperla carnea]